VFSFIRAVSGKRQKTTRPRKINRFVGARASRLGPRRPYSEQFRGLVPLIPRSWKGWKGENGITLNTRARERYTVRTLPTLPNPRILGIFFTTLLRRN
jgi:hypothetical protein